MLIVNRIKTTIKKSYLATGKKINSVNKIKLLNKNGKKLLNKTNQEIK